MTEAVEYALKIKQEFTDKANHNKREALFCFLLILIFSLSAPLFITLTESKLLSKVVPSIISVLSAGLTSWLQLRKPQKLWSTYRNAQRLIEDQITRHQFSISEYAIHEQPDNHLVERTADIMLNAHNEWLGMIPSPESIPSSTQKHGS